MSEETVTKKSLYEKIAERDLYKILEEMGNSRVAIDRFQRGRITQALAVFVITALLGLVLGYVLGTNWLFLGALILPPIVYKMKYNNVKKMYSVLKFHRHLQFSKFTRLLIPYLKQSSGSVSLYSIFNKILQRTETEEDRNSLYKLMTEMTASPSDVKPFIEFAERSSGTDMSILFMSTVFDFQQSSDDASVIDELGQIASEELMNGIDEIIEFKLKRFVFFPTKVVMASFILVVGFAASVLWYNISQFQLF